MSFGGGSFGATGSFGGGSMYGGGGGDDGGVIETVRRNSMSVVAAQSLANSAKMDALELKASSKRAQSTSMGFTIGSFGMLVLALLLIALQQSSISALESQVAALKEDTLQMQNSLGGPTTPTPGGSGTVNLVQLEQRVQTLETASSAAAGQIAALETGLTAKAAQSALTALTTRVSAAETGLAKVPVDHQPTAWVTFNGVNGAAVQYSHNVASVARSQAGLYTITFASAMTNNQYTVTGLCNASNFSGAHLVIEGPGSSQTTTGLVVGCRIEPDTTRGDSDYIMVMVHGGK